MKTTESPRVIESNLNDSGDLPQTLPIRRRSLKTIAKVRDELSRLYWNARETAGPYLDAATASKLGYLLIAIGKSIEGTDLEARLDALEKRTVEQR